MIQVRLVIAVGMGLSLLGTAASAQSLTEKLKLEDVSSLSRAAREQGSAVRGAILFPQQKLGCANCHEPGAQTLSGPDLSRMGPEVTDVYLVEAVLDPSKVIKSGFESVSLLTADGQVFTGRIVQKNEQQLTLREQSAPRRLLTFTTDEIERVAVNPKSGMPDDLVDQLSDRQQFLDLVRYVMELHAAGPSPQLPNVRPPTDNEGLDEARQGLVLMDDLQCAACHQGVRMESTFPLKHAPDLKWGIGRLDPHFIERFIADPGHVKPGTSMPNLLAAENADLRQAAAAELTHYIVSLGSGTFQRQPLDATAGERGRELFHSVGCVACHSPRNQDGSEQLLRDSVALGPVHEKYNLNGLVAFLEDPHAARPASRMPKVPLTHWEAVDIANFLLLPFNDTSAAEPFRVDLKLAEKGRSKFEQVGCIQCHTQDALPTARDYPPLAQVDSERGCLSNQVGPWPQYALDDSQRSALRAAVDHPPAAPTDKQQIAITMTTFRCIACHQRGGLGGIASERDDYFQTTNPNLGPQGRIPPALTGVGAKLNPDWMRQVLVSGRAIRPYMLTRMPQFSPQQVEHLVDLFQHVDPPAEIAVDENLDAEALRKVGHELSGTDGLNCIACHTYQLQPGLTMSAVDLTEMSERLQRGWFFEYMREPQRLSANTVMPSFWPGGRAIRNDILDGNADMQIEAVWQYLSEGRHGRAPKGLVQEPIELLASDEAVMLRRNYPGVGKRGIGVGYPKQVNLVFDAEQMRLAMLWQGKFADPAGVWRSQGHGAVRPLARDVIRLPAGPELDDIDHPWQVDDGRPPQHQFKGYTLDKLRRPTFRYQFDNITVSDSPLDVVDDGTNTPRIRRTLTLTSDAGRDNVGFRAGGGDSVTPEPGGVFLIGKSLRIRVDANHRGEVINVAQGQELRIPLEVPAGESRLVLEYVW